MLSRGNITGPALYRRISRRRLFMLKFLIWLILLFLCWPLALLALLLYPLVWLLLLPFRILGLAVDGILGFLRAVFMLPARVIGGPKRL